MTPIWRVPPVPGAWPAASCPEPATEPSAAPSAAPYDAALWEGVPALPPLTLADGSGPPRQGTEVRVAYTSTALHIRFSCQDDDIWGTHRERDAPVYDEEVVEVFLAPGDRTPTRYYEFEVSPFGALWDGLICNPSGRYDEHLQVDPAWDADGLLWHAAASDGAWWAVLSIPWATVGGPCGRWRANFYRIERSSYSGTELSCWSPTLSPSFHVPARFGYLELETAPEGSDERL